MKKLIELAERQRVKDLLTIELRKLETEIILKGEQNTETAITGDTVKPSQPVKPALPRVSTVDIKTYAWDQSDNYMKIYATVPGVENVPKEQVTCHFTNRSFHLNCQNVGNKNYTCGVKNLMEEIEPEESHFKIKSGNVLVMLKKKAKKTWPYVTEKEKKLKEKEKSSMKSGIDDTTDPQESLMQMMKKMYDEGDPEMKRTIAKAWTESREKQTKDMPF